MATFTRTTEKDSAYRHLENMSSAELVYHMNEEDQTVPMVISKSLPQIAALIDAVSERMASGGRLFYIGAGTSGRLGVVDASECPPTFGVPHGLVIGIIAGGNGAMFHAVEFAEDDYEQAWKDLKEYEIRKNDSVIGIAASGTTPYVIGGLKICQEHGILTGSISCNAGSPVSLVADFPVEVVVGPEFVTGSTRLKSGTAQKLVLNMISTAVMIKLGRVEDNKMVNMQLTNDKLIDRGVKMLMSVSGIQDYVRAKEILLENGSVKGALESLKE